MRGGDYDASFTLLEEAVSLAGADSRRGGEFKLWAVQALQGVGRNKQAVALLESLKAHRDLDVRKVEYKGLSGWWRGITPCFVESTRAGTLKILKKVKNPETSKHLRGSFLAFLLGVNENHICCSGFR